MFTTVKMLLLKNAYELLGSSKEIMPIIYAYSTYIYPCLKHMYTYYTGSMFIHTHICTIYTHSTCVHIYYVTYSMHTHYTYSSLMLTHYTLHLQYMLTNTR